MNALQMLRKARFEVDALRTNNVKSDLWSDEEVLDALNTAMDIAGRIIRLADSDLLSKTIRSTGSSISFVTETYAPSSIQIVADTSDYTLPPDCVRPVSILPITSGMDGVRFRPAKTSQKFFMDNRVIPTTDLTTINNGEMTFYYTIFGSRTLRIVPTPKDTIDVEMVYQYRPSKLFVYTDGTVSVTKDSTTVAGKSTAWSEYMRTPAELIVGSASLAKLDRPYPNVSTIGGDTSLTLAKAYTGATALDQAYCLAMVPTLPDEHHAWLAQMAAAIMLRKIDLDMSDKAAASLEKQLMNEIQPEVSLRQAQESLPVEPFELP